MLGCCHTTFLFIYLFTYFSYTIILVSCVVVPEIAENVPVETAFHSEYSDLLRSVCSRQEVRVRAQTCSRVLANMCTPTAESGASRCVSCASSGREAANVGRNKLYCRDWLTPSVSTTTTSQQCAHRPSLIAWTTS